jgi:acetoacetyl-CoA synthetase
VPSQTQPSTQQNSVSQVVERLTPIWERQLGRHAIGPDDNFFALGGNATIARKLFHDVAAVTLEPPPPVTIFLAPTIASMAAMITRPSSVHFPPLVQLRNGNAAAPPIFLAHGIGSNVLDLLALAAQLKTDRAIYAMQALGIYGNAEPHERVEDMASFYLAEMRKIQPAGPYTLIGYSLGGLVMFEIAQRLHAHDEDVAMLAMLDTYISKHFLRPATYLKFGVRRTAQKMAQRLTNSPARQQEAYSPEVAHQIRMNELAYVRYNPQFYPGELYFVRAAEVSYFPADASAVWGHLVAKFHQDTVPGNHASMLALHSDQIARLISRQLTPNLQ